MSAGHLALPALSVVVPVFNEAGNAGLLCREICAVVSAMTSDFEIIFVNDGSRDGTLTELRAELCALNAEKPRLRVLDLDGNFGEAAALSAGFHAARGDRVVTLDGDGQNDPHDIPRLLAALHGEVRVVTGWRQQRQESTLLRVLPSMIANRLIAAVTRLPVHDNGCGLKAYDREVLGDLHLPSGLHRFLPAILGVRAHEVAEVPVNDRRRQHGVSHYGISRTVIVLRDVLALRFILTHPRLFEAAFGVLTFVAAAVATVAVRRAAPGGALIALLLASVALMNWWNLRRFNRAQRIGVYRVRGEYVREAI
ncbi:MAG: glycosyltransferase family 2 protein [Deltaproteobacteria bacterium]|nr:glycosyltransferase family 2 protein [Deltaproteobacteria bacterium]MBI3387491.1 glycosyltransferase family 2 protein [Deltaproteobacteria bacterium]